MNDAAKILISSNSTPSTKRPGAMRPCPRADRAQCPDRSSFNRSDFLFHEILLRENDRFVERYYADRWYNIFAIHDKDDDRIKGWYCNVTYPAEITADRVSYVDLALDLLAYPDGRYLVLDEDEFSELKLDQETIKNARQALDQLIQLAENGDLARVTG